MIDAGPAIAPGPPSTVAALLKTCPDSVRRRQESEVVAPSAKMHVRD